MDPKLRIVILPGLDGTGRLFEEFANSLSRRYAVEIIDYPPEEILSYEALLDIVTRRLPSADYVLVGESFSGPLALRIAARNPKSLKAVVLGASFARLDLPFKSMLGKLAAMVPVRAVPSVVLDALLMNGRATRDERLRLKRILRGIGPGVLAARARAALSVDLVADGVVVDKPVLYLRAAHDRLIPSTAADLVSTLARDFSVREIPAPHFLFPIEPARAADEIDEFLATRIR